MRKEYEKPCMKVLILCAEEIITSSGMNYDPNENDGGGSGGSTGWDS